MYAKVKKYIRGDQHVEPRRSGLHMWPCNGQITIQVSPACGPPAMAGPVDHTRTLRVLPNLTTHTWGIVATGYMRYFPPAGVLLVLEVLLVLCSSHSSAGRMRLAIPQPERCK